MTYDLIAAGLIFVLILLTQAWADDRRDQGRTERKERD